MWAMDVFKGAGGEANASAFEIMGANIRAKKIALIIHDMRKLGRGEIGLLQAYYKTRRNA